MIGAGWVICLRAGVRMMYTDTGGAEFMGKSRDTEGRLRRYWDKHSRTYDREMRHMDRILFGTPELGSAPKPAAATCSKLLSAPA